MLLAEEGDDIITNGVGATAPFVMLRICNAIKNLKPSNQKWFGSSTIIMLFWTTNPDNYREKDTKVEQTQRTQSTFK